MHIVDLSLPINRHMAGIPARREFLDNPTRCVVFSSLSTRQLERLREQGLEIAEDCQVSHHMMSRLEIVTHVGTHVDAPCHFLDDPQSIDRVPLTSTVKAGRVIPAGGAGCECRGAGLLS